MVLQFTHNHINLHFLKQTGIECLRGLVELDVRYNEIKAVEELVKISSLLHLRILALTGKSLKVNR